MAGVNTIEFQAFFAGQNTSFLLLGCSFGRKQPSFLQKLAVSGLSKLYMFLSCKVFLYSCRDSINYFGEENGIYFDFARKIQKHLEFIVFFVKKFGILQSIGAINISNERIRCQYSNVNGRL